MPGSTNGVFDSGMSSNYFSVPCFLRLHRTSRKTPAMITKIAMIRTPKCPRRDDDAATMVVAPAAVADKKSIAKTPDAVTSTAVRMRVLVDRQRATGVPKSDLWLALSWVSFILGSNQ